MLIYCEVAQPNFEGARFFFLLLMRTIMSVLTRRSFNCFFALGISMTFLFQHVKSLTRCSERKPLLCFKPI